MKTFNYFLITLGGLLIAYVIFSNFVVTLPIYLYQLGRETTNGDIQNYFFIKNLIIALGFAVGWITFKKILV